MPIRRKDFLRLSAAAAVTGMATGFPSCKEKEEKKPVKTPMAAGLKSMVTDLQPVSGKERESRIEKAQRLLKENGMAALILDAGTTSLQYFTGISWWPSERPMVAVIPQRGDPAYVCPGFEEARLRELIKIGKRVYVWQEDESPYRQILNAVQDAGVLSDKLAMEERLRFFIMDGMRREAPRLQFLSGDPVTMNCRLIKSPAEIALMQKASDITSAAIQYGISQLQEGMTPADVSAVIDEAHSQYGGSSPFALVLFGEASAYPHGTTKPQTLKKGDIVLMDCGCEVQGYHSDITRTIVFGKEPTKRQQEIWNLEKQAQSAGFAAAKIGAPCENVDAAARKVITDAGFGPDYKLPGLPHRTGHGIGMDGHEWGNMVRGNKQLLQPGMCFSIEPTIAIPGEFGVRLEDCAYMTEEGVKWFSKTSKSITEPF